MTLLRNTLVLFTPSLLYVPQILRCNQTFSMVMESWRLNEFKVKVNLNTPLLVYHLQGFQYSGDGGGSLPPPAESLLISPPPGKMPPLPPSVDSAPPNFIPSPLKVNSHPTK